MSIHPGIGLIELVLMLFAALIVFALVRLIASAGKSEASARNELDDRESRQLDDLVAHADRMGQRVRNLETIVVERLDEQPPAR